MPTNFPSGVKSRGVPVEGLGGIGSPLLTTGDVYHVDSAQTPQTTTMRQPTRSNPPRPLTARLGNVPPTTAMLSSLLPVTVRPSQPPPQSLSTLLV